MIFRISSCVGSSTARADSAAFTSPNSSRSSMPSTSMQPDWFV